MKNNDQLKEILENHPEIYHEVLDMFKKADVALNWLKTPNRPLNWATPLSIIKDNPEKIMDLLYRIKTGDLS
jgi:uncharacterized protein (DUF2384 family)